MPNNIGRGSGQQFQPRWGINHFPSGTGRTLDFSDHVAGTYFQSAFKHISSLTPLIHTNAFGPANEQASITFPAQTLKGRTFDSTIMIITFGSISKYSLTQTSTTPLKLGVGGGGGGRQDHILRHFFTELLGTQLLHNLPLNVSEEVTFPSRPLPHLKDPLTAACALHKRPWWLSVRLVKESQTC